VGVGRRGDEPGTAEPLAVDVADELVGAETVLVKVDQDGKPAEDDGFDVDVEGFDVANWASYNGESEGDTTAR
jgi:hypothetical protein